MRPTTSIANGPPETLSMQNEESVAQPSAPKGLKVAGIIAAIVAVGVVAAGTVGRAHETRQAQDWSDARGRAHGASRPGQGVRYVGWSDDTWHNGRLGTRPRSTHASAAICAPGTRISARRWARAHLLRRSTRPELDQQIAQARADVTSARANASLAKSTAARWNDLLTTNSVSRQEADEKERRSREQERRGAGIAG